MEISTEPRPAHVLADRPVVQELLERLPRPAFRRVTSSGRFIPVIDGLRFVAIAMVVLSHVQFFASVISKQKYGVVVRHNDPGAPLWSQIVTNCGFGVQLFFVISGFILALPFAAQWLEQSPRVSLRRYFLRRVTRLEPPYLLVMTILAFATVLVNRRLLHATEIFESYGASCFYMHWLIFGTKSVINLVTWSLEVEIQFYLLVPLIAGVFAFRSAALRRFTLLGAALILMGCQLILHLNEYPRFALSILNFGQYFLMGFLLADVYVVDWKRRPLAHWGWDVVSIIGWCSFFLLLTRATAREWLAPGAILILYIAAFRGTVSRAIFGHPIVTAIGGMCYTIYLVHVPVIAGAGRISSRWIFPESYAGFFILQLVALMIPLAIVSTLLFLLIERPCMDAAWPAKLWMRVRRVGRNSA